MIHNCNSGYHEDDNDDNINDDDNNDEDNNNDSDEDNNNDNDDDSDYGNDNEANDCLGDNIARPRTEKETCNCVRNLLWIFF